MASHQEVHGDDDEDNKNICNNYFSILCICLVFIYIILCVDGENLTCLELVVTAAETYESEHEIVYKKKVVLIILFLLQAMMRAHIVIFLGHRKALIYYWSSIQREKNVSAIPKLKKENYGQK